MKKQTIQQHNAHMYVHVYVRMDVHVFCVHLRLSYRIFVSLPFFDVAASVAAHASVAVCRHDMT